MRIDHQGFMNHKKIVSVVAMALIVTLALSASRFVKSPPKQKPKVSSKSSAPAAQETYDLELAAQDPLKIEVVGTYRIGDAEYVQDQIRAILPERLTWSSWSSGDNRFEYEVPSTIDADALAKKIRFGKVTAIQPRLIRVRYSYQHQVPARFKEDVADWRQPPEDDLGPALEKHAGDWWKALGEINSLRTRERNQRGEIVRLSFYSASDETLHQVANLQSLKKLSLSGCRHVTDSGARHLKGLTNLEELELSGTSIGNPGQTHLSSLTNLKWLKLSGNGTETGLKHLTSLTRLESLSIGYSYAYPVTTEGLQYLQGLRNLKALNLDGCEISDTGLEIIAQFSKLEYLTLRSGKMTDAGLANLTSLRQLRQLNLQDCTAIGDEGLVSLRSLKSLVHLNLHGTKFSGAGITLLQPLKDLSTLDLSETAITDAGLLALEPLPLLKWLSLDETTITDGSLAHLQAFPKLTALCLSGTKISDEGLRHLGQMTRLKTLQIDGTQVTDAGMAHLSDLKELRSLDISNTTITEQGLRNLRFAPNLRDIRAEECGISLREIQRFTQR